MKVKERPDTKISARVFRAAEGKWEDLGVVAHPYESNLVIRLIKKHLLGYHFATVLTQKGEEWIVDKLAEGLQTKGDWIAWGTGAGTAGKSDTALFSESPDETRVQGTESQPVADKLRYVGTMTCATNPKTITNAGTFTVVTGGTLVIHGDFTGIPLNVGDKIEFTMDLEIT